MKIIITENKRHRAITKWLDNNYSNLEKYAAHGSHKFIHYKDENRETVFMFNRSTGVVTITEETLHQDLKHMFSLSGYELNDILIPWLEQVYNLHVERVTYSELH